MIEIKAILESLQNEQSETQGSILMLKKALVSQQRSQSDKFNWKTLSAVGLRVALLTALASGLVVNMAIVKANENNANDAILYGKMQSIQDHLGIKSKGASKVKKSQ